MQEIKLAEELKLRYKTLYEKNFENLKILNAVVRLPRMSDQFYKTMKKKEREHIFEKRKKEAVNLMGHYATEANSNEFFTKFIDNLNFSIQEQSKSKINKKSE